MSRSRFGLLAILYAALMAYASTIVGVAGPHYVPISWGEALYQLINMPYVAHGSDQRSDWMGNLVMAVPLGFLVTGWLSRARPSSGGEASGSNAFGAFLPCFAFIILLKYAQLFFPPRTVTLNYVVAQSLGAGVGIFLLGLLRSQLTEFTQGFGRLGVPRLVLRIYTGLLIVFMLMPLDFALNANDLTAQLDKLPDSFTRFGGDGRSLVVWLALLLASVLATMPIGALLTLVGRDRVYVGRSIGAVAWIGFFAMFCVYGATTMVISGAASMPSVGLRTIGIALGAWFMHWLIRQNPDQLRDQPGRLVPWAVPFYLLTLFAVNGLLSFDWTTPDAASDNFYGLGLVPLFNYYIVTKAQAAKNIVAHAVMYAPIGLMVWLRAKNGGSRAKAFILAAMLSSIVEVGRFLRPGLVPDINAVPLAGIAAWATAALMPTLWQTLAAVAIGHPAALPMRPAHHVQPVRGTVSPTPGGWRNRRDIARRADLDQANGDIEHY